MNPSIIRRSHFAAALLAGLALHTSSARALTFQELGGFPGQRIQAVDISADGSAVVGYSRNFNDSSIGIVRWTSNEGMIDLGVEIGDDYLTEDPYVTYSEHSLGISADGSVVVGTRDGANGYEPFRWTSAGGMDYLNVLPGTDSTIATGMSADGSVVIGSSLIPINASPTFEYGHEVFRWTSTGGMVGLGVLPGTAVSEASGLSADGSVIVGASSGFILDDGSAVVFTGVDYDKAFRWTSTGGMVGLGVLPGAAGSVASDVSADGSVIVGSSYTPLSISPYGSNEAFRWTSTDGMVGLGVLPGDSYSFASSISADGAVVVGTSSRLIPGSGVPGLYGDLSSSEVFRWTSTEGMIGLGIGAGRNSSVSGFYMSEDGSVLIVNLGWSYFGAHSESYLWDATNGARSLHSLLADSGMDVSQWEELTATGISADGTAIVGNGYHNGSREAWLITGLAVPEPGTVALLLGGGLWTLLGLRKRRPVRE